jgi:prolyl-tRNA synthetase
VLINQWANVMRWELRTRLFLRTAEFLWQEGHTAHETADEAQAETLRMLDVYADFAEQILAIPVIKGRKTDAEKFPGADTTYTIEGLMQDGKALQCGTSHFLGQNFARAFNIKYLGRDQQEHLAFTTSWGVSTRLIGAMIMAHGDDEGLIVPPYAAPTVAAIVPIHKNDAERAAVKEFLDKLLVQLVGADEVAASAKRLSADGISSFFFDKITGQKIIVDWRDARPGDKQYHWEQRGVPFRMEAGPRDVQGSSFVLKNRLNRDKAIVPLADASAPWLRQKLAAAHQAMLERARTFRDANTRTAANMDELEKILAEHGGLVRCFFQPNRQNEAAIKERTKATVRCIPLEQSGRRGPCVFTGAETDVEVLFAQAY